MRLIIINEMLGDPMIERLKACVGPNSEFVVLDLSAVGNMVTALSALSPNTYESVGIISHGENSAQWGQSLLSVEVAQMLRTICLTTTTSPTTDPVAVDIFACNMASSDVILRVLSNNLGKGIPVFFSLDKTGNPSKSDHDWLLEAALVGGTVPVPPVALGVRDMKALYLTDQVALESFSFAGHKYRMRPPKVIIRERPGAPRKVCPCARMMSRHSRGKGGRD
jgi:hypothetical protein